MADSYADQRGRVTLKIGGTRFLGWQSIEVTRNLEELAGDFVVTARDDVRAIQTLHYATLDDLFFVRPGPQCEISLDGELVLKGYVEKVSPNIDGDMAFVTIQGRDATGDLVDCAAAPDGPGEYRDIDLKTYAERIAGPFGIPVIADVDPGRPFARAPVEVAETALSAIEGHARARGILVLSDGIGNLRLTRTGADRAPAGLSLPGNMLRSSGEFTTTERFSETHVKGTAEKAHGKRGAVPKTVGIGAGDPAAPQGSAATQRERAALSGHGVAYDEEVARYRPRVIPTRHQPDALSPQDEALWHMRQARGRSETHETEVLDWRAPAGTGALWKPNQMASVDDAFLGVNRDMLISGVTYIFDDRGARTGITVKSPETHDLKDTGARRKNRRRRSGGGGPLDGTAREL